MLAVVNQPRTQGTEPASFRIEGDVPKFVLMFLESAFKQSFKIESDDEKCTDVEDWDWYRETMESMTAGETVKADRGLRGWTQKTLASKLGISVQNLSEIERNVRPVSRKMAAKLAEVFETNPASYFRFVK